MTKYEFSDGLRRALTGKLSPARVDEHIRYYEGYIDTEIRKGRSEEEVLLALGDPRLIAKTLLVGTDSDYTYSEAEHNYGYHPGEATTAGYYDSGEDDRGRQGGEGRHQGMHTISFSGLPVLIGFILLLILAMALFIRLLPVLIIAGFIVWIIRRIRGRGL